MRDSPRKGRSRSRLASGATVLSSIVVSLALAEAVVRTLSLVPPVKPIGTTAVGGAYRRSDDPLLRYELKPGLDGSPLRTNRHGQRDVERSVRKLPGTRRIVLLGDSVVEGDGIRDLDDTISRQLERLYAGARTEVLNFGVSGYCTRSEVELLEVKALEYEPDEVVLVFVENDFHCFSMRDLELGVRRARVVSDLFSRSELFRLACLRLDLFRFATETDPARGLNGETLATDNVLEGLRRLAELRDAHGFQVTLAVWPRFLDDAIVDVNVFEGRPDRLIVEELAQVWGIRTVRLSPWFRGDFLRSGGRNPRRQYTVGDKIHPSEEGARVAAAALKQALDARRVPVGGSTRESARAAAVAARTKERSQGLVNLGDALRAQGRTHEAISRYQEALDIDPSLVGLQSKLGALLEEQGGGEGLSYFRRLAQRGGSAVAEFNLAIALASRGKADSAAHHYAEALRIDPDYEQARVNLGILLASSGRSGEAVEQLGEAVRRHPDSAKAFDSLGLVLTQVGRGREALQHLRRAVQLKPEYAQAHTNMAVALLQLGDAPGALDALRVAARLDPEWIRPRATMVWILSTHADVRDPAAAVRMAEELERSSPLDPGVLDTVAAAYASAGLLAEARATAERALAACVGGTDHRLCESIRRHVESLRESVVGRAVVLEVD